MPLQGKGFFIWKIPSCEGGSPDAIAAAAKASGLTHVLLKIADGVNASNYDATRGADLIPPVARALREVGIQVWGWHYIYGSDPLGEARRAIQRLQALGLDGYVVDAEAEFEQAGKARAARSFMAELRAAFPRLPVALSSFRYPNYHRSFPWSEFLEKCDYNMPQVYWEQAHNAAAQLSGVVSQFKQITPFRPILPTGPTYKVNGWRPTEADITAFLDTARSLNLEAANFFSWDECRRDLPYLWKLIADYPWPVGPQPLDVPEALIAALNTRDARQVAALYAPDAVHVTGQRTLQGSQALTDWYTMLLTQVLPEAKFTLTGKGGAGETRMLTWQAVSPRSVAHGSDTLGLRAGHISYHYSYFTLTAAGSPVASPVQIP